MANQDGTGPVWGNGPCTGRGLGPCGASNAQSRRQNFGRGFGQGLRRCRWFSPFGRSADLTQKEEKDILEKEISDAEEYAKSAKERLAELDEKK